MVVEVRLAPVALYPPDHGPAAGFHHRPVRAS
jgi:hypothetical protein